MKSRATDVSTQGTLGDVRGSDLYAGALTIVDAFIVGASMPTA